jgi:hypothetical protein
VCGISGTITGTLQLPATDGVVYSLNGRVSVGSDVGGGGDRPGGAAAQLNIAPGVRIFGSSGADFLVVQRGSQINANGAVDRPIVITSRQDIQGTDQPNDIGQFGGLVILGRAPINSCPARPRAARCNCEAQSKAPTPSTAGPRPTTPAAGCSTCRSSTRASRSAPTTS